MKASLWIIIAISVAFVSFLMGYSLPPFLEVGFGKAGGTAVESGGPSEKDLQKQYEEMYKDVFK